MKDKIRNFMTGRYGVDQLNRFLLGLSLLVMVITIFMGKAKALFYGIALLLIIYMYYRMLSRNYQNRYRENNFYLSCRNKFLNIFRKGKNTVKQRRIYHIYKCPGCKQKIRIPRGKGKISITCPKCRTEFIKKS